MSQPAANMDEHHQSLMTGLITQKFTVAHSVDPMPGAVTVYEVLVL